MMGYYHMGSTEADPSRIDTKLMILYQRLTTHLDPNLWDPGCDPHVSTRGMEAFNEKVKWEDVLTANPNINSMNLQHMAGRMSREPFF